MGDCYVAATGLMQDDGQGFMKITADHDPQQSAARMLEFAKGALAHSKTVMLPRCTPSLRTSSFWTTPSNRWTPSGA